MAVTREQIDQAYREVLGRGVDKAGVAAHSGVKSVGELRKILSQSEEGRRRSNSGAGLTEQEQARLKTLRPNSQEARNLREKQGRSEAVDIAKVGKKDQEYVAAWQAKNPGKPLTKGIYEDEIKYWKNLSNGNVAGYQAYLNGEIVSQSLSNKRGHEAYVVTQDAINRMGGKVDLRVNTTGQIFVTPENATWTTKQKRRKEVQKGGGATVYGGAEAETGGILGGLGIKELENAVYDFIPKEFITAFDPLNITSSYVGGSRMTTRNRETMMDVTGLKAEEVGMIEAVGRTAVTIAATAAGGVGGAIIAGGTSGASAAERGEWLDAAADFAMTAAAVGYSPNAMGVDATRMDRAIRGSTLSLLNTTKDMALGRDVNLGSAAASVATSAVAPFVPKGFERDFTATATALATAASGGSRGEILVSGLVAGATNSATIGNLANTMYQWTKQMNEGPPSPEPRQSGGASGRTTIYRQPAPPPAGSAATRSAGESYI